MNQNKIIYSKSNNPYYNLALEEYYLNKITEDKVVLYLWQNTSTVVIGRNQNPWNECRVKLLQEEDGKLSRRLSGGGAVYQDLGNLNFTFIMKEKDYDLEKQVRVVLEAVRKLGIDAEFSGRNDLVVEDRKFSGNAFYHGGEMAYHHGTILIDTDFDNLSRYLQVSSEKIKSKGVESVRSRVINLNEVNPDLSIDKMKQAMAAAFTELYGGDPEEEYVVPSEMEELEELYEKYSSWNWRFGKTPEFDITFKKRFDWGEFELGLNLKNGYIQSSNIYTDAMEVQLIEKISEALEDIPYKNKEIKQSLHKIIGDEESENIIKDITGWLDERITE